MLRFKFLIAALLTILLLVPLTSSASTVDLSDDDWTNARIAAIPIDVMAKGSEFDNQARTTSNSKMIANTNKMLLATNKPDMGNTSSSVPCRDQIVSLEVTHNSGIIRSNLLIADNIAGKNTEHGSQTGLIANPRENPKLS